MDASLFSAFGLASAAGFNAFVPLLTVGLLARYTDLVRLAEPFDILTQPWVLAVIGVLARFALERYRESWLYKPGAPKKPE